MPTNPFCSLALGMFGQHIRLHTDTQIYRKVDSDLYTKLRARHNVENSQHSTQQKINNDIIHSRKTKVQFQTIEMEKYNLNNLPLQLALTTENHSRKISLHRKLF